MQYDLDYRQTLTGYVAGEAANVPLLQAWLESGGITVTSIDIDVIDLWIAHVDASAEPDLVDSWPAFWNQVDWQIGDPLPTPPDVEAGEPPNNTPATTTYTLDLADTVLGWAPGSDIRADQISQYLTDKGAAAQSVSLDHDGTGALTGQIDVVRLASGSTISPSDWALYNGPASVATYGQTSMGEPPLNTADDQSAQQGTRYGDGSSAESAATTAIGKDARAASGSSTAVGDTALAQGPDATAVGAKSQATGFFSTAVGNEAESSGNSSLSAGTGAKATEDQTTAVGTAAWALAAEATSVGNDAIVREGADRSIAIGSFAEVPTNVKDRAVISTNGLELVASRKNYPHLGDNGINDPTVFMPHDNTGNAHTLGTTTTAAQWDGHDLALASSVTTVSSGLSSEISARIAADSAEVTNRNAAVSVETANRNAAIATHAALTTAHGTASAIVGINDTQTLTHKTLTDATNVFPTFNQSTTGNAATATKLATARTIDGQSFDGSGNITVIAPGTHAATSKGTPVDADELPIVDSAASNVLKKLTWANLKATAKTYFDTLYAAVTHTHAESDITGLVADLAAKIGHPAVHGSGGATLSGTYSGATVIGTVNITLLSGVTYDISADVSFTGFSASGSASARVSCGIAGTVNNGPIVTWSTTATASHPWQRIALGVVGSGASVPITCELTTPFTGTVSGAAWRLKVIATPTS